MSRPPDPPTTPNLPSRREPPPFRRAEVTDVSRRSPHLVRIALGGAELDGFDVGLPAASCRLLLPGDDGVFELPTWNGNEFLRADGRRARIRTLTPVGFDAAASELLVDVVLHDASPLTAWASTAAPGTLTAVSGTGAGYEIAAEAPAFLLSGDESALPAIGTLLPALPHTAEVRVLIEVRDRTAEIELPDHPRATVRWCELAVGDPPGSAQFDALAATDLADGVRIWAAGEAAAMQRIRRHVAEAGVGRDRAHVRGYWKHGREGT